MKYLVMEIHPAYAVLLNEEGRYLKAANLRYQVGDTVEDIIPLRDPAQKTVRLGRPLAGLAAMAACLCLVFFGYYRPNYTAYGTLCIQINPDVEMTISRTERVLALEGLNQDGLDLIEGYNYQGKGRDTATSELVERAIDMGYLSDGDTISITVSSSDAVWQAEEEAKVRRALEDRYGEQVVVRIGGEKDDVPPAQSPPQEVEVVIPVTPQTPSPAGTDQPYGGTDDGPGPHGVTDYNDTDYGPYSDGVTDYADRDGASDDDHAEDDDARDDGGDDNAQDDDTRDSDGDDDTQDDDAGDGDDDDIAEDDEADDGDDDGDDDDNADDDDN